MYGIGMRHGHHTRLLPSTPVIQRGHCARQGNGVRAWCVRSVAAGAQKHSAAPRRAAPRSDSVTSPGPALVSGEPAAPTRPRHAMCPASMRRDLLILATASHYFLNTPSVPAAPYRLSAVNEGAAERLERACGASWIAAREVSPLSRRPRAACVAPSKPPPLSPRPHPPCARVPPACC